MLFRSLKRKYPAILADPVVGKVATDLFADAQKLLARIVDEKLFQANAVYGFFPANSDGDEIIVWTDETRSVERMRFQALRQQWQRQGQTTYRSLADFLAPVGSGVADHLGAFAVSTGFGADELARKFEADRDDPSEIGRAHV